MIRRLAGAFPRCDRRVIASSSAHGLLIGFAPKGCCFSAAANLLRFDTPVRQSLIGAQPTPPIGQPSHSIKQMRYIWNVFINAAPENYAF